MVRIRMKRTGRRHTAAYRVTVVDGRASRDGRVIEELGYYDPNSKVPEQRFVVNGDRVQHWLSKGAQPSDTVRTLLMAAKKEAAAK